MMRAGAAGLPGGQGTITGVEEAEVRHRGGVDTVHSSVGLWQRAGSSRLRPSLIIACCCCGRTNRTFCVGPSWDWF